MAKFKMTSGEQRHDSLDALRKHFSEGTAIFSEGDLGLSMYVIESGDVQIRKRLGDEVKVLAALSKGDFFGEMCMLEEETPRSAEAVAVTEVDLAVIDQATFTFMLNRNPEIAIRMMRKLAGRLRETTRLLEEALGHAVDLDESGATSGPAPKPDPTARLIEETSGIAFPLATEKETTVGRMDPVTGIHPGIDLTTVDPKRSISRRHARIRREEGGGFSLIEDMGTMNGTFVNGNRLETGRPHPLEPGDSLMFGTVQCRFELDSADAD